jgi:anaerobic magnesium-protoporphyrin IX monomethyl ester cyclase
LAASLRQHVRGIDVQILDAPALEMGWQSLEAELRRRQPTWVGIGEEAVSCVEGLRLARFAHDIGARVIAGGCFFGHAAAGALGTGLIDVVVHGEGENTIVDLVEALRAGDRPDLAPVAGISFRDGQDVVRTPARPIIPDLDDLPLPAYDLLPVSRYGARSRNHPRLAAIELGRGCTGSCDFCVLWRQMGRVTGNRVLPHYRAKSPERLIEEVRRLVRVHDRGYLGWVDPCFNADPARPAALAERMLHEGLVVGQSAWVRADAIVRDVADGTLATCVRAGLNEVYLGLERPDDASLDGLGKRSRVEHAREALRILRSDFPDVLTVGSFIYGLPGDTPDHMRAIHRFALELELDQFFCIPLTPLPGTAGWRQEFWDPTGERFREFSFLPGHDPASPNAPLERALRRSAMFYWPRQRLRLTARRLTNTNPRRRRVGWHLFARGARFQAAAALNRALGRPPTSGLSFPAWYAR